MDRDWTVFLIGGASGTGKSSLAYALSRYYSVSVLEADDIHQVLKAITTGTLFPAIHYWSTGANWLDHGIAGNVNWLINVSKEMIPALTAIVNRHIEDNVPVIIEGDFIHPAFAASFKHPAVTSLFVVEPDKEQLVQNFLAREGGDPQRFRAEISVAYGEWMAKTCGELGIRTIAARPWETLMQRAEKKDQV